jgi:hypothetical protein
VDQSAEGSQELSPPERRPTARASPCVAVFCAVGVGLSLSTAMSPRSRRHCPLTICGTHGRQFVSMTVRSGLWHVGGGAALLASAIEAGRRR